MQTVYVVKFPIGICRVGFKKSALDKDELKIALANDFPPFELLAYTYTDTNTESMKLVKEVKALGEKADGSAIKKPRSKKPISGHETSCIKNVDVKALNQLFSSMVEVVAIKIPSGYRVEKGRKGEFSDVKKMSEPSADKLIRLLGGSDGVAEIITNKKASTVLNYTCCIVIDKRSDGYVVDFIEDKPTGEHFYTEIIGDMVKGKYLKALKENMTFENGIYYGDIESTLKLSLAESDEPVESAIEVGKYLHIIDVAPEYYRIMESRYASPKSAKGEIVYTKYFEDISEAYKVKQAIISNVELSEVKGKTLCFKKVNDIGTLFAGMHIAYIELTEIGFKVGIVSDVDALKTKCILREKYYLPSESPEFVNFMSENFEAESDGSYFFSENEAFYNVFKIINFLEA